MDNIARAEVFSLESLMVTAFISVAYLALAAWLVGFRPEQVVLALIFNGFYFASSVSRKFITGFSIFILYWIIFDFMKAFPNYLYRSVSIGELYHVEKMLFGIGTVSGIVTPNEYFVAHNWRWADVMAGLFYLCWVPVPLGFAAYLFFVNRALFLRFSLAFFTVNIIGFIIYYVYPAAPPWYVQQHGFEFVRLSVGSTAGLDRFDQIVQSGVFRALYAKGSNVFAAMPSLHSSYPVIVLYYGLKRRLGYVNVLFAMIMVGIWTAAVYTSHHYVLDVIAGIVCAFAGIIVVEKVICRSERRDSFYNSLLRRIS